jgi:hypothetical protein
MTKMAVRGDLAGRQPVMKTRVVAQRDFAVTWNEFCKYGPYLRKIKLHRRSDLFRVPNGFMDENIQLFR